VTVSSESATVTIRLPWATPVAVGLKKSVNVAEAPAIIFPEYCSWFADVTGMADVSEAGGSTANAAGGEMVTTTLWPMVSMFSKVSSSVARAMLPGSAENTKGDGPTPKLVPARVKITGVGLKRGGCLTVATGFIGRFIGRGGLSCNSFFGFLP